MLNRRGFLHTAFGSSAALGVTALGVSGLVPDWADAADAGNLGIPSLTGRDFDLNISKFPVRINGRATQAIGVNGSVPAPLLRFREGEKITLRVKNSLMTDSSIHWHGLLVPFHMDGVPGVTFPGIKPGETFTYEYAVPQSGTYWYHSHSGLQEQVGHYGPIIIDPKTPDPVKYDREYVLMLGDWTYSNPHHLFAKLKKNAESLNYNKPVFGDKIPMRGMWDRMRMSPRDLADVGGETYTYVINGRSTADNFNMVFRRGERVRLRIINAAAMTLFNVRMPGLPMTIVAADGLNVQPLEVDEFQMGVAETYDVIVEPTEAKAFAFVAETIDRSGQVVASLVPIGSSGRERRAEIPAIRAVPTLTMKDMAMDHSSMGHGNMNHGGAQTVERGLEGGGQVMMDHGKMDHSTMDHNSMGHQASLPPMNPPVDTARNPVMDHSKMNHIMGGPDPYGAEMQLASSEASLEIGPGVVNIAATATNRLHEAGIGLEDMAHRVLTYNQLRSLAPNQDTRKPGREIVVHLTSNMERYMWSFDGVKFSEIKKPIVFMEGERVRLTMVNNTMMPHPIHLHGMFFDVVIPGYNMYGPHGHHAPRKHTIVVKPGEKLSVDVSADHVGDWAFHCHLMYHMHAGMMQVVSVLPTGKTRHVKTGGRTEHKMMNAPEHHMGQTNNQPDMMNHENMQHNKVKHEGMNHNMMNHDRMKKGGDQ